jgi:hypothetical protein
MQSLRQTRLGRGFQLCLLGSAAISLLAGCGGGGGGGGGGGTTTPPANTSISVTTTGVPSGLTATLSENSSAIGVGGSITYTLTLTNNTAANVTVNAVSPTTTQPAAALIVRNAAGTLVYAPLPGFPALDSAILAPGKSLSSTQTVSAFGAAGAYAATATFADTSPATTVGPLVVTAQ